MSGTTVPGSAIELAESVRRGSVSASSALEHSLLRITERDSELHAFVAVDSDGAWAQAANVDALVVVGS